MSVDFGMQGEVCRGRHATLFLLVRGMTDQRSPLTEATATVKSVCPLVEMMH